MLKIILIVVGVIILLTVLSFLWGILALFLSMGVVRKMTAVGETWMKALQDQQYGKAYNLCAAEFQTQLGSAEALQQLMIEHRVEPTSWTFNNQAIRNGVGQVKGTVQLRSGDTKTVELQLLQQNKAWKILSMEVRQAS